MRIAERQHARALNGILLRFRTLCQCQGGQVGVSIVDANQGQIAGHVRRLDGEDWQFFAIGRLDGEQSAFIDDVKIGCDQSLVVDDESCADSHFIAVATLHANRGHRRPHRRDDGLQRLIVGNGQRVAGQAQQQTNHTASNCE